MTRTTSIGTKPSLRQNSSIQRHVALRRVQGGVLIKAVLSVLSVTFFHSRLNRQKKDSFSRSLSSYSSLGEQELSREFRVRVSRMSVFSSLSLVGTFLPATVERSRYGRGHIFLNLGTSKVSKIKY